MGFRYILFGGQYFYAKGGGNDAIAINNSIDLLQAEALVLKEEESIQWWHIYDTQTHAIVVNCKELYNGI